ncbi:MAG: pyridoxamine 5'-phosphate oxidase [Alphaproteobacteria bacterium]|nr:pyridoxamine 5'-phosphate oxidase [Alphaproteobacteria bacterium]
MTERVAGQRIIATADPYELFAAWLAEAEKTEPNDPNAMALATVGPDGTPSIRMVLLKGFDQCGFAFFTNRQSRKGEHLERHPKAAVCLHWKSLRRQVRAEGAVEAVSETESDAYFASRPRGSQIGAWASAQSSPLDHRAELEASVAAFEKKFEGKDVPRPPHWGGYRIKPVLIEFWHDRPHRLHERLVYQYKGGNWTTMQMYP